MRTTLLFLLLFRSCQPSAHRRASVKVTPSGPQYFEYVNISVSCEQGGSAQWTVWRYTAGPESVLSRCGSSWGTVTSSTCNIKTIKVSDSGVYWCESKHRDSSNAINVTVSDRDVILRSLNLPLIEGNDVTLCCETKIPSDHPSEFFKTGSSIGKQPTHQMIIHDFSQSHEGVYKCRVQSSESLSSWLLMKDDSEPASLTVTPNSLQLFEYDNVSLNCGFNSNSRGWRTVRATSSDNKVSTCGDKWGTPTTFGCVLPTCKQLDSAVYWCESPSKQRSNSVSITVHGGSVILQSPVLPVMEGDDVTLRCQTKTPPSNLPAAFYKDGSLIGPESAGHMTIRRVSRSDEGLYKCHIRGRGESPPSWLFVRSPDEVPPPSQLLIILLCHLLACMPYFISTAIAASLYCHKPTGRKPPVSKTMRPRSRSEQLDQPYDDVIPNITTEHHF